MRVRGYYRNEECAPPLRISFLQASRTRIEVGDYPWARTRALLAHETQVDPTAPSWFGSSDDELRETYPYEDWMLARSHVLVSPRVEGQYEFDLFDGVRTPVEETS